MPGLPHGDGLFDEHHGARGFDHPPDYHSDGGFGEEDGFCEEDGFSEEDGFY